MPAKKDKHGFKEGSLPSLFAELADPDKDGFSRPVYLTEFTGKYTPLREGFGNGGKWCRSDGSLGQVFNIKRHKAEETTAEHRKGSIDYVQLHGWRKAKSKQGIPAGIRKVIEQQSCPVLGTSKVEIDHKDGRKDDPRLNNPDQLQMSDFQPLAKAANNAKRQHCKECKKTGKRFDATRLGFAIAQWKGNGDYRGSCVGCYWHDVREFHKQSSTPASRPGED